LDFYLNEGKRVVAPEALASACRDADVVVTDASPQEIEERGLLDPGRVAVAITPYGLEGPRRDWKATAATLLAEGGYTTLMGDQGRAPLTMPGRFPWYQAGSIGYWSSLAALWG